MSKFSKQHYEWIASLFEALMPDKNSTERYHEWRITCAAFSDNLRSDSSHFDPDHFLTACGFTDR